MITSKWANGYMNDVSECIGSANPQESLLWSVHVIVKYITTQQLKELQTQQQQQQQQSSILLFKLQKY